MRRHANIPLFIVHMGCPNQCVFCDQRLISGKSCFSEESVRADIERCLSTLAPGTEAEIAFFGGSFTGIERPQMIRLLGIAQSYVDRGDVSGIRLSTRPDYIDAERVAILSEYRIAMVELGVQSMSDRVLSLCRRGHSAADTERAFALLGQAKIAVGAQMMVGLPGASEEDEVYCARRCAELGAQAYRVYPTVVFRRTELCDMAQRGDYLPLSDIEAASRMAAVMEIMHELDIPCLRAGLCESENLHAPDSYAAGPAHPAIGEMARSRIFYKNMDAALSKTELTEGTQVCFYVPVGCASCAVGQKRENILSLREKYPIKKVKIIENSSLIGYNIKMELSSRSEDSHDK